MATDLHSHHLQTKQLQQEKADLERALFSVQEALQTTSSEKE